MLLPRKNLLLQALLLILVLFGAASGAVEATGHGELASQQQLDLETPAPDDEDCRLRAEEVGKRRQREITSAVQVQRADPLPAHATAAWPVPIRPLPTIGLVPVPSPARDPHACLQASPWLQLKLQLGQAP